MAVFVLCACCAVGCFVGTVAVGLSFIPEIPAWTFIARDLTIAPVLTNVLDVIPFVFRGVVGIRDVILVVLTVNTLDEALRGTHVSKALPVCK
jgi:hypothetical protein